MDSTDAWHNKYYGYCKNPDHIEEHNIRIGPGGACINFVSSERLLEIKQLFDAVEEIEELKLQNTLLLQENEEIIYNLNMEKKWRIYNE